MPADLTQQEMAVSARAFFKSILQQNLMSAEAVQHAANFYGGAVHQSVGGMMPPQVPNFRFEFISTASEPTNLSFLDSARGGRKDTPEKRLQWALNSLDGPRVVLKRQRPVVAEDNVGFAVVDQASLMKHLVANLKPPI